MRQLKLLFLALAALAAMGIRVLPGARGARQRVLSLNYEVMESLSLGFDTQLIGCAAVISAGTYFDTQELEAPSTAAMEERESSLERVLELKKEEDEAKEGKVDIYRDTVLRYAGYLNEVGEAFRPLVPGPLVILSYVLAISYVLADAISKGKETTDDPRNAGISGCGLAAVTDTLAFQFIASIIIPGTIINRWVSLVGYLTFVSIDVSGKISSALGVAHDAVMANVGGVDITCDSIATSAPTAMGLALIPFIVAPIDALTEKFLDEVVRPQLVKQFPDCTLNFAENDFDACGRESSVLKL